MRYCKHSAAHARTSKEVTRYAAPVRDDLPPAIVAALDTCAGPALVFDRARLTRNLRELASVARTHRITALFAAKSFPHPEVWALAAEHLDGFDAASAGELAALPRTRMLSIVDPSGRAAATAPRCDRLVVGCETVAQVHAAPPAAEIALRVSASLTSRDPAMGAILDGTGHRRSRFGLDVARAATDLRALLAAVGDRRVGLHVHHGPVTATSARRFVDTATTALALAARVDWQPHFLDLGGAWHGIADLGAAFAAVRAAVPGELEVIVEPGRVLARGAGFACGRVLVARALDDRELRVVDLSRICHLRWSQVELVGRAPHPGTGRPVVFAGPTCFEDDVLGEWTVDPAHFPDGARVVLRDVTGYAVGWNTGFGGVPPANVVVV